MNAIDIEYPFQAEEPIGKFRVIKIIKTQEGRIGIATDITVHSESFSVFSFLYIPGTAFGILNNLQTAGSAVMEMRWVTILAAETLQEIVHDLLKEGCELISASDNIAFFKGKFPIDMDVE